MDVEEKLDKLVEGTDRTFEEAKAVYDDKYDEVKSNAGDEVPESAIEQQAFGLVRSKMTREEFTSEASSDMVNVISLGVGGPREWQDGNVYIAYGVADPEDDPAHPTVFIFEEEHIEFEEVRESFRPMSSIRVRASLAPNDDISDLYLANSTSETEIEEYESQLSLDERRQWVNENHITERAELAEITDHLSLDGDHSFAGNVGGDIKRMQATIVDYFISSDGENGAYILQDDSIIDPRDLDKETIIADKRSPGLTAWMQDTSMMNYGEDSICDFYGTIRQQDDGQIVMNVFGVVPLPGLANESDIKREAERRQEESEGGRGRDTSTSSDDSAEETKI